MKISVLWTSTPASTWIMLLDTTCTSNIHIPEHLAETVAYIKASFKLVVTWHKMNMISWIKMCLTDVYDQQKFELLIQQILLFFGHCVLSESRLPDTHITTHSDNAMMRVVLQVGSNSQCQSIGFDDACMRDSMFFFLGWPGGCKENK